MVFIQTLNKFHIATENSKDIQFSDGSKYIAKTFNINTRKKKHIIRVYRTHSCLVSTFLNNLQTIIQHSPKHCPFIIMGNFNVDILKKKKPSKKKQKTIIFHG